MKRIARILATIGLLTGTAVAMAEPPIDHDPHYNPVGFFDIHICNWPERPSFLKVLFASAKYEDIDSMIVRYPDGSELTQLDKAKFMLLERKGKPLKKVFMQDLDISPDRPAGWYSIEVSLRDGRRFTARDFVTMSRINRATDMTPADKALLVEPPSELKWNPVPGARYYQVFVRDAWTNEMIVESDLLKEPRLAIKPGLLEPGGLYTWRIHSRDTDGHFMLGDFHAGSMSLPTEFSISD